MARIIFGLGIGRLQEVRKQLNFAFLVSYYVFSILIMSFTLASTSQKTPVSSTGCIVDNYPSLQ